MFRQHGIRDFLRDYDFKLIFLVVSLTVLGVFAVGSARPDLQGRQLMGMSLSIFVMLVVSFVDYHFVLKFYWLIYILNIILLGLVLSPLGDDGGGAQRWLDLKVIRFQPSELAKILLILFFAQFIMINRERLNSFGIILLSAILIAVPLILVVGEDLSTTIVIAIVFCVMLYIGGLSYKLILAGVAPTGPGGVIFLTMVIQPGQKNFQDY